METPVSLSRHAAYQAEYYARLQRLPLFPAVSKIVESFLRIIVERGAFYMRVHRKTLPLILQSGRIKCMMETGTGATLGGPDVRREATRLLFGCDPRRMQPADYPKYGYLSTSDLRREMAWGDEMSYQFGNVVLKMDKERLMHRTTMTVGMSLQHSISERMVPTRTDCIMATCIPGLPTGKAAEANPMGAVNLYAYVAEKVLKREITADNFYKITELMGYDVHFFEFFELQYHGLLDVSRDVESINVYPDDEDAPGFLDEMKKLCADKGVEFNIVDVWG